MNMQHQRFGSVSTLRRDADRPAVIKFVIDGDCDLGPHATVPRYRAVIVAEGPTAEDWAFEAIDLRNVHFGRDQLPSRPAWEVERDTLTNHILRAVMDDVEAKVEKCLRREWEDR